MKRNLLSVFLIAIASLGLCLISPKSYSQVYQFANAGFEEWDGGSDNEPTNWNTYPSAQCDLSGLAALGCSTAKAKKHGKSTDHRPGSTGSYSCFMYSVSVLGVIANGAITSGQMRLGTTSLSSNENYNVTRTANSSFQQKLNAKPDSIVFWARVHNHSATEKACCHLYIHDNYDLKDPLPANPTGYESHLVGKVPSYNFQMGDGKWKRHSVPIDYEGCTNNDPQYILITFSTNVNAGGGSANDSLFIDDIELIYNPNLASLSVDGTPVSGFNANTTDYYITTECGVTNVIDAVTKSPNASATISQTEEAATVTVKHGDKTKVYTIHYIRATVTNISDVICQGKAYNQNGFNLPTQEEAGTFTHQITTYEGETCDSILNLSLKVNKSYNDIQDIQICSSASYDFFGDILNTPGEYQHILTSQEGCDSIISLNLTVGDFYQTTFNATICEGDVYVANGFNRAEAGIDTLFFEATNRCDSLVVLNLSVSQNSITEIYDTIQADELYTNNGIFTGITFNGSEYTFIENTQNKAGCDSTVIYYIKVLEAPANDDYSVPSFIRFEVYPSPARGNEITIKANYKISDEVYSYNIYNSMGKVMDWGLVGSEYTTVNIEKYESGVYYLKVDVQNPGYFDKRTAIKFVVEK